MGAGVALAVGEVAAGLLPRTPSLVAAVASLVIDEAPTAMVRFGIDTFGEADKPALVVGVVALAVLIGAAVAVTARRAGSTLRLAVPFGAFGLVGAFAAVRALQAPAWAAAASATGAAAAGAGAAAALLALSRHPPPRSLSRSLCTESVPNRCTKVSPTTSGGVGEPPSMAEPTRPPSPTNPPASRRAFLAFAGAGAAFAGTAALGGRRLQSLTRAGAARNAIRFPAPARVAPATAGVLDGRAPGLSPYLTPTAEFYRIDTALLVPNVDPATWRLRVTGLVDRPFELTYDELLSLPLVEEEVTLACVSNEVGGNLVGNARWTGVPLPLLLDRAGVQADATQVVGRSVDGWTAGFPTATALDGRTALVAVAMGGEPLPLRHGFPARLVVAGLYGYVSATKWLRELHLTTLEGFDAYWVPRGWAKEGPMKTQSRIDVPRGRILAGPTAVAGVAWAPVRGIGAVEVRIDDGPWQPAQLGGTAGPSTWVQWHLSWDAAPGRHQITVRATDGKGDVQTAERRPPDPDGATGHHRVEVTAT